MEGKFLLYSLWMMISVLLSTNTYAETLGVSYKTHPIVGFHPHMVSIGAQIDKQGNSLFDLSGNPILTVGSRIFINSQYCNMALNDPQFTEVSPELVAFFDYQDIDGDNCFGNLSQLNWYILDSIEQDWNNIDSWEQLDVIEITNEQFPGSIIENVGGGGVALKIPVEAEGKRIGFTYQPYSKTGSPQHGIPLYVWDLNYFFGQNAPNDVGISNVIHEEFKLDEIEKNLNPAGGIVIAQLQPPYVEELSIHGVFSFGETLEAKYQFIANSEHDAEDESKFWWGEQGTTSLLANVNRDSWYLGAISPELTEQNIASVYEVSVRPILKQDHYFVHGKVVTQTTSDDGNHLIQEPKIVDLKIIDPVTGQEFTGDYLVVDNEISAHYQFVPSNNLEDHSYYELSHLSTGNVIKSGNTLAGINGELGMIPRYRIISDDAGEILHLSVVPKDGDSQVGEPVIVKTAFIHEYPSVDNLVIHVRDYPIYGQVFYATYDFVSGTGLEDHSLYRWGNSALPTVTVAESGIIPDYLIQESDVGTTISLIVYPRNELGFRGLGEVIQSPLIYNKPNAFLLGNKIDNGTGNQTTLPSIGDFIRFTYKISLCPVCDDVSAYTVYFGDELIDSGDIVISGESPTYEIKPEYAGKSMRFELIPKDSFGQIGDMEEVITQSINNKPFVTRIVSPILPAQFSLSMYVHLIENEVTDATTYTLINLTDDIVMHTDVPMVVRSGGRVSDIYTNTHNLDSSKKYRFIFKPKNSNGLEGDEYIYETKF